MGVAYYIMLDNEDPGFDTFVNGKFLAHETNLHALCEKLGIKSIEDFFSMSEDDISDILGEEIELPESEGVKWFTPEEGLTWVSALANHIKVNPKSVKNTQGCLEDLSEFEDVLNKVKGIGANWHLNLDI